MSEWLKEHAWNACKVQAFKGSNPFLSAIFPYFYVLIQYDQLRINNIIFANENINKG